jgi:hypothetical protein
LNLIRVMPAKGQDIMATSIFLARLLGPLLIAVGAGILINPKPFHTMASEVVRSVTLVYLFGLFDFAAGLAIVLTHNVWTANWRSDHTHRLAYADPRRGSHLGAGNHHGLCRQGHPQQTALSDFRRRHRRARALVLLFRLCRLAIRPSQE